MSFVAGADHREHRQPAGAGDTQQGEQATERRKDGEVERIKRPLFKDLQGRNEGEEKGKQDREQRA